MGTDYTTSFTVITDKKLRFPRFFVQNKTTWNFTISALKYDDHNIMATLQPIRVWMKFNKFSTHREASIRFLKYEYAGPTLHSTAKQYVINALMNIKLSDSDINTLKQYSNNDDIHNSSNKKNLDGTTNRLPCLRSFHQTYWFLKQICSCHYHRLRNSLPSSLCNITKVNFFWFSYTFNSTRTHLNNRYDNSK